MVRQRRRGNRLVVQTRRQERRECLFDLASSHLALGHVCAVKGDRERALEAYTLAGRMFEVMGVSPGQKRVRVALAALDAGDPPLRGAWRAGETSERE
ncbi:MAG: hypothetical protein ACREIR_10295 [Geminicoccaceae bacterium]